MLIEHGTETLENFLVFAEIFQTISEVGALCCGEAGEGISCCRCDYRGGPGAADGALPLRVESGREEKGQEHDRGSFHEHSLLKETHRAACARCVLLVN